MWLIVTGANDTFCQNIKETERDHDARYIIIHNNNGFIASSTSIREWIEISS